MKKFSRNWRNPLHFHFELFAIYKSGTVDFQCCYHLLVLLCCLTIYILVVKCRVGNFTGRPTKIKLDSILTKIWQITQSIRCSLNNYHIKFIKFSKIYLLMQLYTWCLKYVKLCNKKIVLLPRSIQILEIISDNSNQFGLKEKTSKCIEILVLVRTMGGHWEIILGGINFYFRNIHQ